MPAGRTICAHSAGSSLEGRLKVICSNTVTVSPFCTWPKVSPAKEARPRTLTLEVLTEAEAGGSRTTFFLTRDAFFAVAVEAFSAAGAAVPGVGVVSCARSMTEVNGANAATIQTFNFITSQVEI